MAISVYEQLNSMGLNINRSTLQQVSASILKRAEEKNSQYKVDNTRNFFQKRDIGVDLYSGNVDLRLTKQIALNNSGLQIQLNQETLSKINWEFLCHVFLCLFLVLSSTFYYMSKTVCICFKIIYTFIFKIPKYNLKN